jgi:hypothetical protein
MAGPNYFTQSDLEARFGEQRVRSVFSDTGKAELSTRFAQACKVASRRIEGILGAGWNCDAIVQLLANDEDIFAAGCDLAMADGMKTGRPEWSAGDGSKAPYAALKADAEKVLTQYAQGQLKSRGEDVAGANPHRRPAKVGTRTFIFGTSRDRPTRGGY